MMDEKQGPPEFETGDDPLGGENSGLTRRDFLKAAAVLTGSTLLLLSRCGFPVDLEDGELPPIPADFKRFILARQSPSVATESIVVALGSQCPDLSCALWWLEDQSFEFFESAEQIMAAYTGDGRTQLHWLD